jgi:hypothetical protein
MTHDLDFNDAAKLGWEIEPRFEARKGDQVFRGTAAELSKQIAEHEERATMHAERREHVLHQERHVPISRLVRLFGKLEEEHQRHWAEYSDTGANHHARMLALERATAMRKRQVETFKQLFERPKEALLANPDFRASRSALRRLARTTRPPLSTP